MNYIGSKYSLLDFLETTIADVTGYHNGDNYIFADLFSGTVRHLQDSIFRCHRKDVSRCHRQRQSGKYSACCKRSGLRRHLPQLVGNLNRHLLKPTSSDP